MSKDQPVDEGTISFGEFPVCECCKRQFIDPEGTKLCRTCSPFIQAECNRARKADRKLYTEIINLYGTPTCDNLHHPKKYQHRAIESCPVEERIAELQQLMKEGE